MHTERLLIIRLNKPIREYVKLERNTVRNLKI